MLVGAVLFTFIFFYADLKLNRYGISIFGRDWSLFMLISGLILIVISYFTREKAVLGYSLFLLLIWFISEGKIRSGSYTGIWLGLIFPIRLFLMSLIVIGFGYIHNNNSRVLKFINKNKRYRIFTNSYYALGLLLGLLPTWYASINSDWYSTGFFPHKYTALLFAVLVTSLSIISMYIGFIKNSRIFLYFGATFIALEIYGKFYQVFNNRLNSIVFWGISIVIGIVFAGAIEYIKDHKDEIRKELIH
jgi:hypothetical protein